MKISDIDKLTKRSRAKWSQAWLIDALINLDSPLKKKYVSTRFCNDLLTKSGDKIVSRYCNRRWCKICCRIRTGKLLNYYEPILKKSPDLHLVTLTLPNVKASKLKETIQVMIKACRTIQETRRKTNLARIKGIRKLECTYNAKEDTYHPHFHFIISKEDHARQFLEAWMAIFPQANIKGQDIRPCKGYKEIFKYFTKFTSKTGENGNQMHYPQALDIIFQAIEKQRTIQPFGMRQISEEIEPEIPLQEMNFSSLI